MKKPGSMKPGAGSRERPQGKLPPSGINKPVQQAKPVVKRPGVTYTSLTQKQKS